jgi:hypothetical protein
MQPVNASPILILLLLASCAPTTVQQLEKSGATKLPPKQVVELTEGNTMQFNSFTEDTFFYFDPSSNVFGKDIHNNKDTGRWDVSEDGELCMRMSKWWYGDLRCFQVYVLADDYFLSTGNGALEFRTTRLIGDAKSLYHQIPSKQKKSYRRSARNDEQKEPTQPQPTGKTSDALQEPPPPPAKPIPEQPLVTEENSYRNSTREQDLRSTVKWMARDCPGCNLAYTDLKKADLVGADLAGANLQGANLRMANMRRANLEGANLEDALLGRANMPGANLRNANLRGADLKGANLIRSDLTGAELEGANLQGALLDGVKGMQ